jgi:hypothetical protein
VNARVQLVSAYLFFVFMALFALGFWVLAGFMPPPNPAESAQAIARQFQGNTTGIRAGMLVLEFAAALLLPWCGAVAVQMKRVERGHTVLTYTWLAASGILVLEFIYPIMFWLVAAFRPHEAPAILQHFNDLAWLTFLGVVTTAVVQALALGIVALRDTRPTPVFPRWFGYFNIWSATLFCPASLIIFFKHGPFAWNGVIAFWFVAIVFFAWMLVVTVVLIGAIRHQQLEEANGTEPVSSAPAAQLAALSAQVAELSAQVAELQRERAMS